MEQYNKGFNKKTRRGKVVRIIQEKYLRSDVEYGTLCGKTISLDLLKEFVIQAPHKQLLVLDTNIALHQIDVLEYNCPATSLIVLAQTVLLELKHLNLSVFRRVTELIKDTTRTFIVFANEHATSTVVLREDKESMNDANDRAIVKAAEHYSIALSDIGDVVFITNDIANKERAVRNGLTSMSMRQYIDRYVTDYPELLDLVAADDSDTTSCITKSAYPAHLPMNELMIGLKSKKYFRGVIRCQRDNNPADCYVIVEYPTESGGSTRQSVLVKGFSRVNRGVDGDIVAVQLCDTEYDNDVLSVVVTESNVDDAVGIHDMTATPTPEAIEGIAVTATTTTSNGGSSSKVGSSAVYGRVVGIIRRNWRQYAGSLDISTISMNNSINGSASGGSNGGSATSVSVQFVPVDKRIPRIWITTRRIEELSACKLLVSMDQWPADSLYPVGHYVRVFGPEGDKGVETQVLLHEFDVPHEAFSPAVMACLPPPDWSITPEVIADRRTDLRHIPVVSIDPPGCKDIDDALHCIRLPNGRLQAGVHIADVSYFVHPGTAIDQEAAHRSTSTYLVERRLDMLPGYLTTQLCSLRSNEDHLAFSVIWEMDDEANIYDVKFFKSAIHSVASLSYDEAQIMLDAPLPSDKVNNSVNLLNKLARVLRQRRIDMGALTLASPEVRFKLDTETQNPTDVAMYALKESNALVEEWMLLANITVSKQILRFYPTLGILRRHQPPSKEQFAPLLSAAQAVGAILDISSSKTLADSLDLAVRADDPYFNKLLRILSTRCMMPAQYFCSGEIPKDQWHHYGLATPVYTHFTSPIRRYADILVHRLLAASIDVIALPAANADRTKQQEICTHMNRRHRAAQYAQRASVGLHTLIYFRQHPSIEAAYVLSVTEERCTVLVPRFGIEGNLRWDRIVAGLEIVLQSQVSNTAAKKKLKIDHAGVDADRKSALIKRISCEFSATSHSMMISYCEAQASISPVVMLKITVFDRVQISIKVKDNDGISSDRKLVIGLVHNGIDLEELLQSNDCGSKNNGSNVDNRNSSNMEIM